MSSQISEIADLAIITIVQDPDEPSLLILQEDSTPYQITTAAEQGPPGPPSKSTFVFVQSDPSTQWIVTHNLGCYPTVSVFDSSGLLIADYEYQDQNTIIIRSAFAISGTAYLN